jgi:hypothetical protein
MSALELDRLAEMFRLELKPANFYQACIYAWNAYREDKTLTSVKTIPRRASVPSRLS